jgi:hypothetical protein
MCGAQGDRWGGGKGAPTPTNFQPLFGTGRSGSGMPLSRALYGSASRTAQTPSGNSLCAPARAAAPAAKLYGGFAERSLTQPGGQKESWGPFRWFGTRLRTFWYKGPLGEPIPPFRRVQRPRLRPEPNPTAPRIVPRSPPRAPPRRVCRTPMHRYLTQRASALTRSLEPPHACKDHATRFPPRLATVRSFGPRQHSALFARHWTGRSQKSLTISTLATFGRLGIGNRLV